MSKINNDARANNHKEIIELSLDKGVDINSKDETGGTPIHITANKGYKYIPEVLIARGEVTQFLQSVDTCSYVCLSCQVLLFKAQLSI